MICIDCGATVRANAKRCHSCAVKAGMSFFSRSKGDILQVRKPGICRRSNCDNVVEPSARGPQRVYCCKACQKADVAMRERARRGAEGRAMHAEANRKYRASLKEAREAQKARELAERIERINAKARRMMEA